MFDMILVADVMLLMWNAEDYCVLNHILFC